MTPALAAALPWLFVALIGAVILFRYAPGSTFDTLTPREFLDHYWFHIFAGLMAIGAFAQVMSCAAKGVTP